MQPKLLTLSTSLSEQIEYRIVDRSGLGLCKVIMQYHRMALISEPNSYNYTELGNTREILFIETFAPESSLNNAVYRMVLFSRTS